MLTGTVRDFQQSHPDFQAYLNHDYNPTRNLVQTTIGSDRKPVLNSVIGDYINPWNGQNEPYQAIDSPESFAQWFNDVPGVNQTKVISIPLEKQGNIYVYDSDITPIGTGTPTGFFPIDNELFGNEFNAHNYHFSFELHKKFTYNGGEVFSFRGDDDVWLFINDQLVIDLGGVHYPQEESINLDDLGLVLGESYDFDFFYLERQTSNSNMLISTSIDLSPEIPSCTSNVTFNNLNKSQIYSGAGQNFPSIFSYQGTNGDNVWDITVKGTGTGFDPMSNTITTTNGSSSAYSNPRWPTANGIWFEGLYNDQLIDFEFTFNRVSGSDPLSLFVHSAESSDDETDTLTTTGSDWVLGEYGNLSEAPNINAKTAVLSDKSLNSNTEVGYWITSTVFSGSTGVVNWNYNYEYPGAGNSGSQMVGFQVETPCEPVAPVVPVNQCYAMSDNEAALYSFDLDMSTPPTSVPTSMIINGEGATYRATNNSIYSFHQSSGTTTNDPSDLYKIELDGTTTLITPNFLPDQVVGAEFVQYADGNERLLVLVRQTNSRIEIFDAADLSNATPISSIPLTLSGSNAHVDGLAINPTTGEVLVVDDAASSGTNSGAAGDPSIDYIEIYSVDMSSGELTLKQTLSERGVDAESLSFAEDGNLYLESDQYYASPTYDDVILRVDLTSGNLIPVEDISSVSGDIEGMSCTGSKLITPVGGSTISGRVFNDVNSNDAFNSGEPLLANIKVSLQVINSDGSINPFKIDASTNSVGIYQISGLEDGTYQVTVDENDVDLPAYHIVGGNNPLIITINGSNVGDADFPFDEVVCSGFSGEVNEVSLPLSSQFKATDKIFIPSKSISGYEGHLRSYSIDASGVQSTTTDWDAAASSKMTSRATKLYSTNDSQQLALFDSLTVPDQTVQDYTFNSVLGSISKGNNLEVLSNNLNTSLYLSDNAYRNYFINTVSTRSKRVLMSSDDGFLYAFDYDTGELVWAWMPRSLTTELTGTDNSHQSKDLMDGTIDILDLKDGANYATYVVGSYKSGRGHYVLKLNSDGNLDSVVWDEDQSGFSKSPNNGEMEFFRGGNGQAYAAYVLANNTDSSTLKIMSIVNNTVNMTVDLDFQASSTPFVMPDYGRANAPISKTLYLGSTNGDIHSGKLLQGSGALANSADLKDELEDSPVASMSNSPTDPVLFIDSSVSAKDSLYYLSTQTATRLTLHRYEHAPTATSSWKKAWTSYSSGAGRWVADTYTRDTSGVPTDKGGFDIVPPAKGIQSLPLGATITDKITIVGDSVVLPLTAKSASSSTCYGKAYYYFYSLSSGEFPTNTFYKNDDTIISTNVALGYGEAKQLNITDMKGTDKLLGYGIADQDTNLQSGIATSFVIKDPFTSGIRAWKEIGRH